MIVYIVFAGYDYEGYHPQSIFSTKEKAQAEVTRLKDTKRWDNVKFECFQVDGDDNERE